MLLEFLDEAYDKKSWHGPNLRSALKGVTAEQAARRVAPGRHNIWEFALHAAYWKYVARRRLTGEKRGAFVIPGSNFFERPVEATEAEWKKDLEILAQEHLKLRAAVSKMKSLTKEQEHLIRGAAAHDLYHAGQIRLLRRMLD
jgi:DinB superfamily